MTDTLLKETAGETLQGNIDGVNTDYVVSFDFNPDTVNIYVNGLLRVKDWDNGFWTISPRMVRLKEPLLVGDSLEIEYKADVKTGGGAEGGCPSSPQLSVMQPCVNNAEQNLPELGSDVVQPRITADRAPCGTNVATTNLRPTILPNDSSEGGC